MEIVRFMKQTLLALFVFIISSNAFSQAFEFRVLASRGDNSIKTKGSEEWTALKTGSTIFSGSELKLGEGG